MAAWSTSTTITTSCDVVLFLMGGLVPLASDATLPLFLRVASGWEILLQNFSTGAVVALLLGSGAAPKLPRRPALAAICTLRPPLRTMFQRTASFCANARCGAGTLLLD